MPKPKYLAMYLVAFALVVAVVSSIPGLTKSYLSGQPIESRLLVGTIVWPGYEPLYLARDLGKFPADRIRLVEFSTATQAARALVNSVVDAAALTLDEALRVAALGIDIEIVLVLDVSNGGDVVLSNPEFADMPSLRGQRIGVESTALGAFVLQRALTLHGLSKADVEIVSLEIDEHAQAIRTQSVDAVVTFHPLAGRLKAGGLIEVFSSKEIPGEIIDVLVVRSDKLEQYADTIELLTAEWFAALNYIEENPADAHARMAPRLEVNVADVAKELAMLKFPTREQNLEYLGASNRLRELVQEVTPVLEYPPETHADIHARIAVNSDYVQ